MSEGKTNRIASLTAKSLKNLFGGREGRREMSAHRGRHSTVGYVWRLTYWGTGQEQDREPRLRREDPKSSKL